MCACACVPQVKARGVALWDDVVAAGATKKLARAEIGAEDEAMIMYVA